ncbi:hypothetical protein [Leptolyngbya ohadii]|uniref:hypothetical protein n=1 Tax=Leptolyngbya ohadii TaxID=1962290 RepID=UPI000B59C210|nr:hypothetical protein [Leptolyngbya ohadii]
MPLVLGASILGGGLISIAAALHFHGQSAKSAIAQSPQTPTTIAAPTAAKPNSSAATRTPSEQETTPPSHQTSVQSLAQTNPANSVQDNFQTADLPSIGTVQEMVAGDLMCYMTVQDDRNVTHRVGATFEVCEQTSFLNQRVRLSYEPASVNDCESAEPCGKSRSVLLVSRLELISSSRSNEGVPLTYTITNGEWTITVGNLESWSGVNNTGSISYRGCNSQNECLQLQGGRMSCRDGICAIGWQNGDYLYSLETPMTEANAARQTEATTLTVRQGDIIILRAGGFREVLN